MEKRFWREVKGSILSVPETFLQYLSLLIALSVFGSLFIWLAAGSSSGRHRERKTEGFEFEFLNR
ncbi:hypothetical protein ACSAZL_04870 [Methanosarcina sp. T3]|uniref:hypothetical protein n=1 Tax=Methanosarcina sp. T3 TaxID=3439062 RepID=UPI003F86D6FF